MGGTRAEPDTVGGGSGGGGSVDVVLDSANVFQEIVSGLEEDFEKAQSDIEGAREDWVESLTTIGEEKVAALSAEGKRSVLAIMFSRILALGSISNAKWTAIRAINGTPITRSSADSAEVNVPGTNQYITSD